MSYHIHGLSIKQFLDDAIVRGDSFFIEADLDVIVTSLELVTSVQEAYEAGGYLYKEIYYLLEQGYKG